MDTALCPLQSPSRVTRVVNLGWVCCKTMSLHTRMPRMFQGPSWQAVGRATKKVSNFSYLMRPACFRATDQASITQIEEDGIFGLSPTFNGSGL